MMKRCAVLLSMTIGLSAHACFAADLFALGRDTGDLSSNEISGGEIRGRVSVVDGGALWFPQYAVAVRLAGVDACALPQWAFEPDGAPASVSSPPVPCGPLAKAWLKRIVGNAAVTCRLTLDTSGNRKTARCAARGHDLGLEMLRVGWARTTAAGRGDLQYSAAERYARSARYGFWGTYVLDMDEWQQRAVDRTVSRGPAADRNLLASLQAEITPPFADWRRRALRTDR
ncbi:thermonuclease family protein [Rhizobium sp. BK376]|uniref:thermonuclease family protein n=1 Tax=Rhizobium sp. BK376 TaxID=2512149 RepID=UPI0010D5FE32|nr:thermonuclease family protein [Rhizobium sp. BK376]TCR80804.1 endonuclease YncB(thermonuclease family) [Rhizobium sp. BK376]